MKGISPGNVGPSGDAGTAVPARDVVRCPLCGASFAQGSAAACQACGRLFHGCGMVACPHCGHEFPRLR